MSQPVPKEMTWFELAMSFPFNEDDRDEVQDIRFKVERYARRLWKKSGRGELTTFGEENSGDIGGMNDA